MAINFKDKKVLITAGPTWVKIDSVRVISNTASGETGILLAERLNSLGAKVTLLLGPVNACSLNSKIELIRFRFFDELKFLLKKELAGREYDLAIHTAAVSDYKSESIYREKIKSGLKNLKIRLKPTPKIINIFKKMRPGIFLAGFKFEAEASKKTLFKKAHQLIKASDADLVLANTLRGKNYFAYLINGKKCFGPFLNKKAAADILIENIEKKLI